MHVRRIQLQSIRALGSGLPLDLTLEPLDGTLAGWTVVVGPNGSGKSTLLKSIALACVGAEVGVLLQRPRAWWLAEGARGGFVTVTLDKGPRDAWHLPSQEFVGVGERSEVRLRIDVATQKITGSSEDRAQFGPWIDLDQTPGWFVAGYGPYRRLSSGAHVPGLDERESRPAAQLASLFDDDTGLLSPVSWLKQLKLEMEDGKPARDLLPKILALISDGLLPGSAKAVGVSSDGLLLREFGTTLPVGSLSDGYQSILALVLDITRQLSLAYDSLRIGSRGGRMVVENEGVILIDEIEAHLHPAWQRRIGPWFVEHFPNMQFIVATHSPFIVQSATSGCVIRLARPDEEVPSRVLSGRALEAVIAGTADDVYLSGLFGVDSTRSGYADAMVTRASRLEARVLAGEATEQELEEYQILKSRLPASADVLVALKALQVRL